MNPPSESPMNCPRKWLKPSFKPSFSIIYRKWLGSFLFFPSFHGNKDAKWWLNDGQRPNMIKWAQTMISHPVSPSMMESKSWNHSPEAVHKIVAGQTMPWRHCSSLFATAPWWDPLALRVLVRSGEHGSWESWSSCKDESKPFETYWLIKMCILGT